MRKHLNILETQHIQFVLNCVHYRRAPFFEGYKFREWCRKGSSWKSFSRMTLVVRAATLYNTRKLARATRQATLEDIMAKGVAF